MEDLNEEYGLSSFENFYDKFLGNSMKQANEKNQEWRDAQDVEKALIDYCHGQEPSHRFSPITILDLRAFAKFYAKRCGVDVDGECEHPYHSIVGGNGSPERCLKCGRVLSE
jgi:hypothetical protein